MEVLERELAIRRIEEVFDELGDETLARIFLPNGLGGEAMDTEDRDVEDLANVFEGYGIPRELWDILDGNATDPAEAQALCEEATLRVMEPRSYLINEPRAV